MLTPPPRPTLFPYTTLFRSQHQRHQPSTQPEPCNGAERRGAKQPLHELRRSQPQDKPEESLGSTLHDRELPKSQPRSRTRDRKSTRLNSSHSSISYAVFCLK